ncbi:hypothetical protein L3067_00520 [Xanthomonas sp. PPL568]|uniref:hypothetical protein n=1 Tax=Xanthomonas indica TaxID=2912242 RepID=UPI001F55AD3A|nr:hypothetical protein [Xanthomonas indica]MCI2243094.1 hypothetical protein [Xanthomonas indica]
MLERKPRSDASTWPLGAADQAIASQGAVKPGKGKSGLGNRDSDAPCSMRRLASGNGIAACAGMLE